MMVSNIRIVNEKISYGDSSVVVDDDDDGDDDHDDDDVDNE